MESNGLPSNIFSEQFDIFISQCSQHERDIIRQSMPQGQGPKPNIARQQLKKLKKIVQMQQNSQIKNLLVQKVYPVIAYQYVLGDLQAKPLILNLLKRLKAHLQTLESLSDKLFNFQQVKRVVQIFETLTLTQNDKLQLQKLLHEVMVQLAKYLHEGTQNIAKNQFRTKWLDKFVQILRCVNFMIRFGGNYFSDSQEYKGVMTTINADLSVCIENCHALTKQVITQLYLGSVFLDPNQPAPQPILNRVHYLHACGIVKNQNTILQMLEIVMAAKDTEIKAQLSPILLKAFQMNFVKEQVDEKLKANCFDIVITLFEVGRSIYSYLEEIVDIIIQNGGAWNLQGKFIRKFFIARMALKHTTAQHIIKLWPTIIADCINQSGNMTIPYVSDCTQILLFKIYQESNKNYQQWMNRWIDQYKQALLANNRTLTRGIVDFINPIILKIDPNPHLLSQLLNFSKSHTLQNAQLSVISLLKCYRELGKIVSCTSQIVEEQEKVNKKQKKVKITYRQKFPQIPQNTFIHIDNPLGLQITQAYLLDLLYSNQSMVSCKTLEFLTTSKKPSTLILPEEMDLIVEFYRGCLKTSMPEYRKNYLNLTRRMLQRFRKLYERDLLQKSKKQTAYYPEFRKFINELISLSFFNIYPDSIFEITNPALQILFLIVTLFGEKEVEIRKGTFIQPSKFLQNNTQFFNIHNFYNLVSCLKSSYESIRKLAHKILENFKISKFGEQDRLQIKKLWQQSLDHTNKLSIKSYEFSCRLLSYISTSILQQSSQFPQLQQLISEIPHRYQLKQLNICQLMLNIMKARYQIFKQQFIEQSQLYYSNLLHGILTFFSYLMENQIFIPHNATSEQYQEIQQFLTQFFTQITLILSFAVQISSANVSTVVLDTLAHGSQTDKKLKVDCRGHFLTENQEKKGSTIGSYLDSTALLTSMENQQQGIQNTLVVSFYLLTRQAGLVFQTIGELVNHKKSNQIIPKQQLITLIQTYFYALINLKHMGSVDRISIGLSKMSKVIFDHEDQDLNKIPEKLLEKLISNLSEGKFTNILRRSAGVPYAFSCLLKSQALKRKHLIQKTINCLLELSDQSESTPIQLRIHSLNILKKLFQDSDLKQDLDIFVSDAFIKSINGFTSEEWGVRNSALMLFTALANRTIGIKPTYNLLQFFHKCPKLLSFIEQKLTSLKTITMYPPLYPIVLLLSRLLPFDIKDKARMSIKGDNNSSKQVRKDQLLKLLPLIQSAGDNHNFMGRVMTAKAILPFMELTAIVPQCLSLLNQFFTNARNKNICNNSQHYRLTQCYQLFLSYKQIISTNKLSLMEQQETLKQQIYTTLIKNTQLINKQIKELCSPTIQQILFKIYHEMLSFYYPVSPNKPQPQISQLYKNIHHQLCPNFQNIIKQEISFSEGVIAGDLGLSLMHISVIDLLQLCEQYFVENAGDCSNQNCLQYVAYIEHIVSKKIDRKVDNQIRCLIIEKICEILRIKNSMENPTLKELQSAVFKWMQNLDLSSIINDDIMINALQLLSSAQTLVSSPIYKSQHHSILGYLRDYEQNSENKYIKMAIFKYFQNYLAIAKEQANQISQFLLQLLRKYSNPDQLEELRETCVEYFQEIKQKASSTYLVVYLRLLEDQQQQIRKRTSQAICKILGIPSCNEQILSNKLLTKFIKDQQLPLSKFLADILEQNSDYLIKYKNYKESRIFSYDKPNKYRTDINTLFKIVKLLDHQGVIELKKVISEKQNSERYQWKNIIQQIKVYKQKIMQRDQYQFQKLIRGMLLLLPQGADHFECIRGEHPIFASLFQFLNHI